MIDLIRRKALRAYSRLLFWKWDREYRTAVVRMRECVHTNTVFVDVGSSPYNAIEKCCDCWALRMPKLSANPLEKISRDMMEWVPNSVNPRRARQVAPPNTRVS